MSCAQRLETSCFQQIRQETPRSPYLSQTSQCRIEKLFASDADRFHIADEVYLSLHADRFRRQNQEAGEERYKLSWEDMECLFRGSPVSLSQDDYRPPVSKDRSSRPITKKALASYLPEPQDKTGRVLRVKLPSSAWPSILHDFQSSTAYPGNLPINTYSYQFSIHLALYELGLSLFNQNKGENFITMNIMTLSLHQAITRLLFPRNGKIMCFVSGELSESPYRLLWKHDILPTSLTVSLTDYSTSRNMKEHPLTPTDHDLLHANSGLSDEEL